MQQVSEPLERYYISVIMYRSEKKNGEESGEAVLVRLGLMRP